MLANVLVLHHIIIRLDFGIAGFLMPALLKHSKKHPLYTVLMIGRISFGVSMGSNVAGTAEKQLSYFTPSLAKRAAGDSSSNLLT